MICLRCNNETFVEAPNAVIEQEFKGETLHVQTPALACSNCGWITLDPARADELRRRTADAYRRKHGLLTSDGIKALRKVLEMNQIEFAAYLGVGESSVKRWETWLVQEKSSDELIRMKCREALSEKPAPTASLLAQHHFKITITMAKAASQAPKLSRWKFQPDLTQNQLSLCMADEHEESGVSPPERRCDEVVAFSLSMPYIAKTLKKEMLTAASPATTKSNNYDNAATFTIAAQRPHVYQPQGEIPRGWQRFRLSCP
jgi:putative zinc finger/helix-turn-helix YgiT family protein